MDKGQKNQKETGKLNKRWQMEQAVREIEREALEIRSRITTDQK